MGIDQGMGCLRKEKKRELRKNVRGFPGGPVVNICLPMQGHRFDPWSGKIPHATEHQIPCTTTSIIAASKNKYKTASK